MSKQPLVKPTRRPCLRQAVRCASRSCGVRARSSPRSASEACGRIPARSSARSTVAVPGLPTTTDGRRVGGSAARFPSRSRRPSRWRSSPPPCRPRPTRRAPWPDAPEHGSPRRRAATRLMPCSLRVTRMASPSNGADRFDAGFLELGLGRARAARRLRELLAVRRQRPWRRDRSAKFMLFGSTTTGLPACAPRRSRRGSPACVSTPLA